MNPKDSRRFGGIERLYGQAAFEAITTAHVCVVGLGGVGSWCAEALARSGVGTLTLVDGDTVAESNINRQLPALENTLGQAKASVLARRFAAINPEGNFRAIEHFIDADNLNSIIPANAIIVDAIDSLAAKAAFLQVAHRFAQGLRLSCRRIRSQKDPEIRYHCGLQHSTGHQKCSSRSRP